MVSLTRRQVYPVDSQRPVRFVGDNLDRLLDLLARARAAQDEPGAADRRRLDPLATRNSA